MTTRKQELLNTQGSCTYELKVLFTVCERPVQLQARPNPNMETWGHGVGHTVSPLDEELLEVANC